MKELQMAPNPYYQSDLVTIYHADANQILDKLGEKTADLVITDPPYTQRTHANARGRNTVGISNFDAITESRLRETLELCGRVSRGWVIATLDYRHVVSYELQPPAGLKLLRFGVWVKTSPTPQISGDRPAQGWEAIAYMHRTDTRPTWNGGGKHGNYVLDIDRDSRGNHPTAKPIALVRDLVRKFSNRNDLIIDPFCGSGTTLRACVDEGRRAIGIEISEAYCELSARRLDQLALDLTGVTE